MNDLALRLTKATEKFENNFKEKLDNAELDEKTNNALYDLGAVIKHLMDDVIDIVDNH